MNDRERREIEGRIHMQRLCAERARLREAAAESITNTAEYAARKAFSAACALVYTQEADFLERLIGEEPETVTPIADADERHKEAARDAVIEEIAMDHLSGRQLEG